MKTNRYLMLAVVTLIAASCSDDFLESTPVMSTVETQFYASDEDMYKACIACYDPLQYIQSAGNVVTVGEIRSDNGNTGGGAETTGGLQDMEGFKEDDVNVISVAMWQHYYQGIYYCNVLLDQDYTSDVSDVYRAEALTLRAWYHFSILRMYGPCVISTRSTYENDYPFERSTREEVNAQIESDLLTAIPLLNEVYTSDQVGRITKGAAQAILAKHYLYAADWDNDNKETFAKVIPLLEEIISDGNYNLIPYEELFGERGNNNAESIFEVQRCSTASQSGLGSYNDYEGSYWMKWIAPRNLTHEIYTSGWGMWVPTADLYNYFMDDDTLRRDEAFFTIDELDEVPYTSDPTKLSVWTYTGYNPIDFEGYEQKKYRIETEFVTSTVDTNNNLPGGNLRLIRYSDVYLMLAEAYLRSSQYNESRAIDLINELRSVHVPAGRAVADMMAYDPVRFPTILDVIWYERRCEFACEGDRWFDLVRSGRAEKIMVEFCANGRLNDRFILTWKKEYNYMPVGLVETTTCPTISTYPDEAYQ